MNPLALYAVGGLFTIALLFSGMYELSSVVGNVNYERVEGVQTATVVITSATLLDEGAAEDATLGAGDDLGLEESDQRVEDVAVEESPSEQVPEAVDAVDEEESDTESTDTTAQHNAIAALQEQVNSLLNQVAEVSESNSNGGSEQTYFVTPSGVKLDAQGNVVDDSGEVVQQEEDVQEVTQSAQEQSLPYGYYRLPSGVIMGPGGVVVNEEDVTEAQTLQEQSFQTQSTSCFQLPSGNKINAYGQPCD